MSLLDSLRRALSWSPIGRSYPARVVVRLLDLVVPLVIVLGLLTAVAYVHGERTPVEVWQKVTAPPIVHPAGPNVVGNIIEVPPLPSPPVK